MFNIVDTTSYSWKNLSRAAKIYYKKHGGFETQDYKNIPKIKKYKIRKRKRKLCLKLYRWSTSADQYLEATHSIRAEEVLSKILI